MAIKAVDKKRPTVRWVLSGQARTLMVGLLTFGIYLSLSWFFLNPRGLWSPDEGAKWLQMVHLRWEDGLKADIVYQGTALDPDLEFVPFDQSRGLLRLHNGRIFLRRLPLFPALSKPLYAWLGFRGLIILPALGGALMSMATILLVDRRDRRPVMWLLVAFASPVFIYSLLFWEHTLASGLALIAVWLALRERSRVGSGPGRSGWLQGLKWVGVGLVLGFSIALRLEIIIFAAAFLAAAWLLVPNQRAGIFVIGLILVFGVTAQAVVNDQLFGQITPDNAAYLFYPFRYLSRAGLESVRDLLIGPFSDEAIDPGWPGTLWAVSAVAAFALSFVRHRYTVTRYLWLAFMGLTVLAAAAFLFSGTPYRAAHGLLFTTPWILLGYCRFRELWAGQNQAARVLGLTAILGLAGYIVGIVFLRAASPQGGLEWGSRFFLTFMPLVAIMAGWRTADSAQGKVVIHFLLAAFMFLGIGFQIRGIMTIGEDKKHSQELVQELNEARQLGYYLSSYLWWLPLNASSVYAEEAIYVFQDPETQELWLERVDSSPISRFAVVTLDKNWLEYALEIRPDFPFRLDQVRQIDNLWILYLSRST